MKAFCLIRDQPVYRRGAFLSGLKAAGFETRHGPPQDVEAGDVLVMWNRYADNHAAATRFEEAGGSVLIAENGYLGVDRSDRRRYALARDGHNGSGFWYVGSEARFPALDVKLQPWRWGDSAGHILVCPNRSFGRPGYIMPPTWPEDVARRIRKFTQRTVRIRPHPGNNLPKKPLAEDLENAHAVVIWSSSAGVEALMAGVPVFCEAPAWICKSAASKDLRSIDSPNLTEREPVLERLAWAQWHVDEIAAGLPFQVLCNHPVSCYGLG